MLEKNWQGYYVCPEHNEPRQTQDFVRAIPDMQNVPWSQPAITPVYVYTNTTVGYSDGVHLTYQLGSGLYPTTVTNVKVDGFFPIGFTDNGFGGITLTVAPPAQGTRITASGMETVA